MMGSACDKSYAYNTFIFNWVKNYDEQIIILTNAMESLQNKVQIYNHLSYQQLKEVIEKYNECQFEKFVKTADNQIILLHSEILTRLQTNSTLKDMTRLFIVQKLLDYTDMDDENLYKIDEIIKERQKKLNQSNTLYSGLTISLRADELNSSFRDSPFMEVFARNFRNYANTLPMNLIHKETLKEIKYQRCYKINIEFGSNGTNKSNLVLGNGISGDVLRDFF